MKTLLQINPKIVGPSVGAFFLGVAWLGAADLADIPPPTPPLVADVPNLADWTIEVAQVSGIGAKGKTSSVRSSEISEVRSTKTGQIKRDAITYGDGTKRDHWFIGNLMLWKTDEGVIVANDLSAMFVEDPTEASPSIPTGFPGTAWLKPAFFEKVVLQEKRPCYHFVGPGVEAWIDVETKLPVAYKKGEIIYKYTFGTAPVEPLVLPEDYQKILEKAQRSLDRRAAIQEKLRLRRW